MTPTLGVPPAPFADAFPVPQRLVAARWNGRLSVPIRAGSHRFHSDLPESAIWGYDGTVPGPTIEAEAGEPECTGCPGRSRCEVRCGLASSAGAQQAYALAGEAG
jgi:hypothetical protein